MTAVTKQNLKDHLYVTMGLSKVETKIIVDIFFDTIRKTLARGEEVKLSGFGNFILRDNWARPGRIPKTGEPSEISARRVATFHGSPVLKSIAMGCREMEGVGTDLSGTAWVLGDGVYARARAVANFPGATTIVVN